jgi:hypothetical protein
MTINGDSAMQLASYATTHTNTAQLRSPPALTNTQAKDLSTSRHQRRSQKELSQTAPLSQTTGQLACLCITVQ